MKKDAQFRKLRKYITRRQKFDSEPSNIQEVEKDFLEKVVNLPMKNESLEKIAVVRRCKKSDIDDPKHDKWCVYSEDLSKCLGKYPTKEQAERRLRQVEYFKHKKKASEVLDEKIKELKEEALAYYSALGIVPTRDEIVIFVLEALADEFGVAYEDLAPSIIERVEDLV